MEHPSRRSYATHPVAKPRLLAHVYTIFTGQRWHIDLCRNETASSAVGLSGFGGQCDGSCVVYAAGCDRSRNIIQTARNVLDGNDRIAGVAWAICVRHFLR